MSGVLVMTFKIPNMKILLRLPIVMLLRNSLLNRMSQNALGLVVLKSQLQLQKVNKQETNEVANLHCLVCLVM